MEINNMMVAEALKKEMEAALMTAYAREFKNEAAADPTSYKKQAAVISDLALVLVKFLATQVQVNAGIPTAGSPASQISIGPGTLV